MEEQNFIRRKEEHLKHSLSSASQASESSTLLDYELVHDSLPDLDLGAISIEARVLGALRRTPFYIAGMTAGHPEARQINAMLASTAARRGWMMGLGSQRRELDQDFLDHDLLSLRGEHPELALLSNLGIAQVIEISKSNSWSNLKNLLERTRPTALAVHLNPLQEAIQPEGTRDFRGGLKALQRLCDRSSVPVLLKETGSGMSRSFLERIAGLPIQAVDVSGLGGTHWGRIEGFRSGVGTEGSRFGETFKTWGIPTADSILNARMVFKTGTIEIHASGGIRSGLDAAKCLALGATAVGFAQPALEHALKGKEALDRWMACIEHELRIALFCTNTASVSGLDARKITKNSRGGLHVQK